MPRLGLTLLLVCLLPAGVRAQEADRPNVVVILTDDQGYADASAWGGTDVRTPNLDRLAAEGLHFSRMRSNGTVCSPTRAALMTGRDADRVGVPGVIRTAPDNSWGRLAPDAPMLPAVLRSAGYHTAMVGKWHLGLTPSDAPNARGFDLFRGFLGDMMDSYTSHRRHDQNYLRHNGAPIEATGHATDLFTEWAIAYLRERASAAAATSATTTSSRQPFFLYLAYNAPHFPIEPPAEWVARVQARAPDMPELRRKAVAFDEHLDAAVGRVLAALDETGLARDTLVVFTSDNGGSLPHGQRNDPWRGGKQQHYDGGVRVPFAVRWPGRVTAGRRTDHPGQTFDIYATLLDLAGIAPPEGMDAVSFAPVLRGEPMETSTRAMYFVRREGGAAHGGNAYHAIVRGPWKLLQNTPYSPLELYHLDRDPQERTNLADTEPDVLRDLQAVLQRRIQRGGAVPWQ
ncbi:sulfatase-like hydrolase/transferase [Luteitalea sp.]|uniref:sulfatase family protein n=1 Tax=Luteitalea sp. TaxID=2004800 RepID=UPI000A4B3A89|nr:sulfatase-like hydrolase/transferase [Luteitalea sp.]